MCKYGDIGSPAMPAAKAMMTAMAARAIARAKGRTTVCVSGACRWTATVASRLKCGWASACVACRMCWAEPKPLVCT
jgi:hypothetical protein